MTACNILSTLSNSYRVPWTALKQMDQRLLRRKTTEPALTVGQTIFEDYAIAFQRDPAARNWLEVLLFYPGVQAILFYRFARWLYEWDIPFFPRFLSHIARFLTGIEIHPGAKIGNRVFIDHGMGVVIGETAEIGNNCLLYNVIPVDIGKGEQFAPEFLKISPNNKFPAIVD